MTLKSSYQQIAINVALITAGKLQELSYRKQIARQLRIQYVDGIYSYPVTLKSKLGVTQSH